MKKIFVILLCLLSLLTGCSSEEETPIEETTVEEIELYDVPSSFSNDCVLKDISSIKEEDTISNANVVLINGTVVSLSKETVDESSKEKVLIAIVNDENNNMSELLIETGSNAVLSDYEDIENHTVATKGYLAGYDIEYNVPIMIVTGIYDRNDDKTYSTKLGVAYVEELNTVYVDSITLDLDKETIHVGDATRAVVSYYPNDATNKDTVFYSSDKKIATIASNGAIKGVAAGTVIITAECNSISVEKKLTVIKEESKENTSGSGVIRSTPAKTSENNISSSATSGEMVWIPATGAKYHSINNCGRMNPSKARQIPIEDAIAQGYEACSKCH